MPRGETNGARSQKTPDRAQLKGGVIPLRDVLGLFVALSRSLKCSAAMLDCWLLQHGVDPDTYGIDSDCT